MEQLIFWYTFNLMVTFNTRYFYHYFVRENLGDFQSVDVILTDILFPVEIATTVMQTVEVIIIIIFF